MYPSFKNDLLLDITFIICSFYKLCLISSLLKCARSYYVHSNARMYFPPKSLLVVSLFLDATDTRRWNCALNHFEENAFLATSFIGLVKFKGM